MSRRGAQRDGSPAVQIGDGAVDACRDRPRIHVRGDRHHDARGPGEAARADGSRPSRRRAPSPTSPSTGRTRTSRRMLGRGGISSSRTAISSCEDGEITHYRWGKALRLDPPPDEGDGAAAGGLSPAALRPVARLVHVSRIRPIAARAAIRRGGMPDLSVNGVAIDDTFAEAFGMRATAIVITAPNREMGAPGGDHDDRLCHLGHRLRLRGGIDVELPPSATPDGRPGCRVMIFAVSTDELQKQLLNRVGQCVLTSPGTACFAGLDGPSRAEARRGAALFRRRLADLQEARRQAFLAHSGDGRRVPVRGDDRHDQGRRRRRQSSDHGRRPAPRRLAAAEAAVAAIAKVAGAIMPFPGGIVRSGSKIGGKYKGMIASTNEAYAPTLRGVVKSELGARHQRGAGNRHRRPDQRRGRARP